MSCISSVHFDVIINGQTGNHFVPTRRLRQGDPISLYLFILIGEVLSCMIQRAIEQRQLDGIKLGAQGPIISHLFFVDDSLLFLKVDTKNCNQLKLLLQLYCEASGQKVNMHKSSVFFGANVPHCLAVQLGYALGMMVVDNPGIYLGVPTIWGRSKKRGLAYVKGRILEKLQGWKHHSLSRAGREVLIKAVVQAIPAYPMSMFKFPANVCQELDAVVAAFWWGSRDGVRKTHCDTPRPRSRHAGRHVR